MSIERQLEEELVVKSRVSGRFGLYIDSESFKHCTV